MQQEQPGGQQGDSQPQGAAQEKASPTAATPTQQEQQQQQEQRWTWTPASQQAQWDAAAHGSSTGCFVIPEDFSAKQFLDTSMQMGEQFIRWKQQDGNWPQMPDSSSGNAGDEAAVQGFNSYAAGMQAHGPEFVGLVLGVQVQMQQLQQAMQGLQASVNHIGLGVNTVLQQQQLTVELQHKALQGIDGLLASNVSLHQSAHDMRQHLSTMQQDVLAAATGHAQPRTGSKGGQLSRDKMRKRAAATVADSGAEGSSAAAATPGLSAAPAAAAAANATEVAGPEVYTKWPGAPALLSGRLVREGLQALHA